MCERKRSPLGIFKQSEFDASGTVWVIVVSQIQNSQQAWKVLAKTFSSVTANCWPSSVTALVCNDNGVSKHLKWKHAFFFKVKSSTALCRRKEEWEAAFLEYVVCLYCRYQCWVGGKEQMKKTSLATCHISVPALHLCANEPFAWHRWQNANPESICIFKFLDVSSKRLPMAKLFRRRDSKRCWGTSNAEIFPSVKHFPHLTWNLTATSALSGASHGSDGVV